MFLEFPVYYIYCSLSLIHVMFVVGHELLEYALTIVPMIIPYASDFYSVKE